MSDQEQQLRRETAEYFFRACYSKVPQSFVNFNESKDRQLIDTCFSRMKAAYKLIGQDIKSDFEQEVFIGEE